MLQWGRNCRIWLPASMSLLFSSCYSVAIASEYLCLLDKGQKLQQVEQPSPEEQLLFARVGQIKHFAEKSLLLRPTQNYSRYVRLDRDYLTAVVSAAPQLGFEDYLWSYPFVGKLPYRGYFDPAKAKKEAARLERQGYDVFVRPVDAFSSLGYVRDPLFSYMADYSETRLAELIIHESFHATLFVRGDIALNESLANLVGRHGAQLYLQDQYGSQAQQQSTAEREQAQRQKQLQQQDRQTFRRMVLALKEELGAIYQDKSLTREQALKAKQQTIARWQQQFRPAQYGSIFTGTSYQYMANFTVNNAYLALFSLYEDPDNFLDNIHAQFLQQSGSALAALRDFIALSRKLSKRHGRNTRQALRQYLVP